MHNLNMFAFDLSDVPNNYAEVVQQAQSAPVVLEKHGRREAVLVSSESFDRFIETTEELDDILAFDEALSEEGENARWDEVKSELGCV